MNPYAALQIAEDHQARLRGVRVSFAPMDWSLRDARHAAVTATRRARTATGWVLVELGLKLAVSVSRPPVPVSHAPSRRDELV